MSDDESLPTSSPRSPCPGPDASVETVQLAHGGGGRAMAWLLGSIIRPAFLDPELERQHDGATLELDGPVAFTTDSYVVKPLVFPGGDIGTLAVNGTVNDLAMCGARPLYLSVGLILEEGLPLDMLRRVVGSMRDAAKAAGVRLVRATRRAIDRRRTISASRGRAGGARSTDAAASRSPLPALPAS
jgi:hydrogenase expression/formation protein HypE